MTSAISWLTEIPWYFFAIILADVWQWTPFMFVILLAGLTAIPPHLYEAAELDGVNAVADLLATSPCRSSRR